MLFGGPIVGVVHLLPLPGSPRWGGSMGAVVERALLDARAYAEGGAHGIVVENYGDAPFLKGDLPPETVAALACCALRVREAVALPVGVNALRNDARAAVGIAAAVGAAFVRVNVHAGVVATDQGILEGRAADTLRVRAALGADVRILADVHVKHGRTLHCEDVAAAARDLVERGGADGVIVTGPATGAPADPVQLRAVREAIPGTLLLAGSGVSEESIGAVLSIADAAIVGTSLKRGGKVGEPVEAARVRRLVAAAAKT